MKEISVKLYRFEELSEAAQEKVIEKTRHECNLAEMYAYDYRGTLETFEELTGVRVKQWSVDGNTFDFRFSYGVSSYIPDGYLHEMEAEEIRGKYLWRWVMNTVWDDIHPKKNYYRPESGWNKEEHRFNKERKSKVLRSTSNCVLTGMCYDEYILAPIEEYLSKPYDEQYSLYDLLNDCLKNFFKAWRDDIAWCNSDEGVKEYLTECDDNDYYANGNVFDGVAA